MKGISQFYESLALPVIRIKELPLPIPSLMSVAVEERKQPGGTLAHMLCVHGNGFTIGDRPLLQGAYLQGKKIPISSKSVNENYFESQIDESTVRWLRQPTAIFNLNVVTKGGKASRSIIDSKYVSPEPLPAKIVSSSPALIKTGDNKPDKTLMIRMENFLDPQARANSGPAAAAGSWRVFISGQEVPVMSVSPDGSRLLVTLSGPLLEGANDIDVWNLATNKSGTLAGGVTIEKAGLPQPEKETPPVPSVKANENETLIPPTKTETEQEKPGLPEP